MLHKVLVFLPQIASDKLIILRVEIANNLALLLRALRLTGYLSQHLVQRHRRRCNLDVRKVIIKPDNFLIQKTDIFRQMLDVICQNHIHKDKLSRLLDSAQKLGPISLGVFYTAAGPADA